MRSNNRNISALLFISVGVRPINMLY